eukprot:jgi/Chlat1/6716/Chrsp50S06428
MSSAAPLAGLTVPLSFCSRPVRTRPVVFCQRGNKEAAVKMGALKMKAASIPEQKEVADVTYPLTLVPDDANASLEDALSFIESNTDWLDGQLQKHGAILFRDFSTREPQDFERFVVAFGWPNLPYVGGAAVRRVVGERVVTANESPPDQLIPFHHEMAQVAKFPSRLFFFAHMPSKEGGETPIVRSDIVYAQLAEQNPAFVKLLEKHGVRYTRTMPEEDDPSSAIGRGWKSTYHVTRREDAEAKVRESGADWEWLPDGSLKTTSAAMPAVRTDFRTGQKVFFNSIVAAYTGWNDSRNVGSKAVTHAHDGKPLDPDAIEAAVKIMTENKVAFRWQQGDVLLVDNMLSMHSRHSFVGPRVILASLIQ